MIDNLLREYAEKFGDSFPIYGCDYKDEDELAEIIQDCINTNSPYEPQYKEDIDY